MLIKKIVFAGMLFFFFTNYAFCEMAGLELNVNTSDVEGKFEFILPHYEKNIIPGAGVLYSDDRYLLSNVNLSVRDQVFSPALSLGLGFKGTFGTAEKPYGGDYDAGALGFLLIGEYDFRKDYTAAPISLVATLSGAPDPLCLMDTDRFFDFSFTVYGHIIKNASVLAGYRHLNFQFGENRNEEKVIDNAIYVGCKLHF
ncbi:MAG: hypothetical protein C0403_20035 [Desulfobacterium sp.]|nr:hypothetical protein [Desulfobacterium sp.]